MRFRAAAMGMVMGVMGVMPGLRAGGAMAASPQTPAQTPAENPALVAAAVEHAALVVAPPGARISLGPVTGAQYMQACAAGLVVTISGAAPYEQAAAHCPAPDWTLYVTVTVAQSENVVVTARPVAAGAALSADDLEISEVPVASYAGREVFYSTAQLLGADAVMSLPAGTILSAEDIDAPVIVKAGQTANVEVISGSVEVSILAVADETGRIGDTILFTNPSSGRRFSALITQAGPVVRLQS